MIDAPKLTPIWVRVCRYADMMEQDVENLENQYVDIDAEPSAVRDPPPAAPRSEGASAAAGSPPPADPLQSAPAGPPKPHPQGRGWIPSATRVEAQHPDGYSWRETDDEIELSIPLPAEARGKQDLSVELQPDAIRIAVLGEEVLSGALCGRIHAEESSWTIDTADGADGGLVLQVDLFKKRLSGEPELWGYVLESQRGAAAPT
jgi:hypothetical protein